MLQGMGGEDLAGKGAAESPWSIVSVNDCRSAASVVTLKKQVCKYIWGVRLLF